MARNKFKIENDLVATMFKRLDKDTRGYENKLIELTEEQLQQKIKECKAKGFIPEIFHQEEFGDGMRFVKDGEGLDDITGTMTYKQLKKFTNECKREVEKECRKQIKEGNILLLRNGLYPFYTGTRLYNIFCKYAEGISKTIITFETLLYLVMCTGTVEDLMKLLFQLKNDNIYFHFIDCSVCTACLDKEDYLENYIDVLINEYFLENLLTKMHKEKELSDEEFEEYSILGEDYIEEPFDDEEFERFIGQYE